jgi:uncharacterized protein YcbK (DUF882 family)
MTIKLTDAAKFYKELPHQSDAFDWLQKNTSKEILEQFSTKYRTPPANKPKEFPNTWEGVYAAGKEAGAKFPEVVAAQWALESGWGQHTSGKNNYFGLKGSGSSVQTQEYLNGQWVTINDGFIDFNDLYSCVEYLVSRWYLDYKQYKGVNRASSRNECANLLQAEGYATDPAYATKLIQIMDRQLNTPGGNTQTNKFVPSSPFSHRVTPNVTYGELTLNQEARRFTKQFQCDTALVLCNFLEKVRTQFNNKPIIVTSCSRPEPINTQIGGARNSEHTFDAAGKGAVDFYIEGENIYRVQDWCDKNWTQSLGYGAPKGFIHLGMRPGGGRIRWVY